MVEVYFFSYVAFAGKLGGYCYLNIQYDTDVLCIGMIQLYMRTINNNGLWVTKCVVTSMCVKTTSN